MADLLKNLMLSSYSNYDRHQPLISTGAIDNLVSNRHTCPFCSTVLLRHVSFGKLYWRCSHCYEAMPVL
jgi:hypothetical protein